MKENTISKKNKGRIPSTSPSPDRNLAPQSTKDLELNVDKELVLKIIVAKLEASKSCDWHELSKKIGKFGTGGIVSKGKIAKGKKGVDEEGGLSGTELHDLYHNTILPALRNGRALWRDSPEPLSKSTSLASPEATTPTSPAEEEEDDMGLDSGEETQVIKSRPRRKSAVNGNEKKSHVYAEMEEEEEDDEVDKGTGYSDDAEGTEYSDID
ncbi:hypothetical protein CI109_100265 [Kwoniella shandongensis]|uniref:Uncharacterized protein n=1 Tax=Kwoniella shandongensis TaxID=1734106 RepID=A0AAJ8LCE5_9TREE